MPSMKSQWEAVRDALALESARINARRSPPRRQDESRVDEAQWYADPKNPRSLQQSLPAALREIVAPGNPCAPTAPPPPPTDEWLIREVVSSWQRMRREKGRDPWPSTGLKNPYLAFVPNYPIPGVLGVLRDGRFLVCLGPGTMEYPEEP